MEQEINYLKKLNHPNIIKLIDCFVNSFTINCVLELAIEDLVRKTIFLKKIFGAISKNFEKKN